MKYFIPALCLGLALGIGTASAQTATPAPTKKEQPAPAKKQEKERSAKSLECSTKANDQGLHGKKRHKYMRKCNKGEI